VRPKNTDLQLKAVVKYYHNEGVGWPGDLSFSGTHAGSNVEHVAEGGVSQDEFEQVLERGFADRLMSRSGSGRWIARDYTDAGRYLVVVFELDRLQDEQPWGITPVTAYSPQAPPTKE
jgi:hypothetical protein